MKGSLKRDYSYPVIYTANDLKSLSDLLEKDFNEVTYLIKTKDGARYIVNNIEEVLEYTNPDSRKIEMLSISGNKEKEKHPLLPDVCVYLFDSSIYDKSCMLELNRMDEKDILFYANKIDEFIKKTRVPYWWAHKDAFYWTVGIVLYILFGFIYLTHTNANDSTDKVYNILLLQGVFALCLYFSMFVLNKIVSLLYPKGCFAIGKQEKHKIKKEKIRNVVIGTIIGAVLLGIVSNIIAHFIIKLF